MPQLTNRKSVALEIIDKINDDYANLIRKETDELAKESLRKERDAKISAQIEAEKEVKKALSKSPSSKAELKDAVAGAKEVSPKSEPKALVPQGFRKNLKDIPLGASLSEIEDKLAKEKLQELDKGVTSGAPTKAPRQVSDVMMKRGVTEPLPSGTKAIPLPGTPPPDPGRALIPVGRGTGKTIPGPETSLVVSSKAKRAENSIIDKLAKTPGPYGKAAAFALGTLIPGEIGPEPSKDYSKLKVPPEEPKNLKETIAAASSSTPTEPKKEPYPMASFPRKPGEYQELKSERKKYQDTGYAQVMADVLTQDAEAKKKLNAARDTNDWAQVASLIGAGLTKYAAAQRGLKENVDLSNIKIDLPDWDKMLDQDKDEYQRELATIGLKKSQAKELYEAGKEEFDKAEDVRLANEKTNITEANRREADEEKANREANIRSQLEASSDKRKALIDEENRKSREEVASMRISSTTDKKAATAETKEEEAKNKAFAQLEGDLLAGKTDKQLREPLSKAWEMLSEEQKRVLVDKHGNDIKAFFGGNAATGVSAAEMVSYIKSAAQLPTSAIQGGILPASPKAPPKAPPGYTYMKNKVTGELRLVPTN